MGESGRTLSMYHSLVADEDLKTGHVFFLLAMHGSRDVVSVWYCEHGGFCGGGAMVLFGDLYLTWWFSRGEELDMEKMFLLRWRALNRVG